MEGITNRKAYYKAVVTCMFPDGTYFQEFGTINGLIDEKINEPIKKPYFYSLFLLENGIPFNQLSEEELLKTYRYQALEKTLKKVK